MELFELNGSVILCSKTSMGYEKSRIVGLTDKQLEQLVCGICHGVLNNPVSTQCCRQSYCEDCIEEWINCAANCPNDRQSLAVGDLQAVPRALVNMINELQIKCDHHSEGCDQVLTIETLAEHLSQCEFRPNARCKSCRQMRASVATHDCIQTLLEENKKLSSVIIDKDRANAKGRALFQMKINKMQQELAAVRTEFNHKIDLLCRMLNKL